MLERGILIALEGIDGAGKTTQASLLEAALTSVGICVVRTKEPTDGRWGSLLRRSASTGRLPANEELEAFTEDRKEHVREVIAPALASKSIVIVDRYYFSSAAYQGARGLDIEEILAQNESFAPQPDLLVILDVPAAVGLSRVRARGDLANLFEQEETLVRTRQIFSEFNRPYKKLFDGTPPPRNILREILAWFFNHVIFGQMCLKTNKIECEPAFCVFRLSGSCSFPNYSVDQMVEHADPIRDR